MTVSGGYGANVSGTTDSNGYYHLSITPTNVGGPFALNFAVTSAFGNYNTTQGNITVTAPIVVPVAKVLAGTVIAGQTGTMPNQGAYTSSVSTAVGGSTLYTRIPQGAYLTNTGSGYPEITTSVPDLVSGNILGGKNILGVAGGIRNMPGTYTSTSYWADGNGALNNWIPYGAYLTDSGSGSGTPNIRVYDPNFIASNIRSGSSIFGVAGTAIDGAGMKNYATGSGSGSGSVASVTGLSFRPTMILLVIPGNYTYSLSSFANPYEAYAMCDWGSIRTSANITANGFSMGTWNVPNPVFTWYAWG